MQDPEIEDIFLPLEAFRPDGTRKQYIPAEEYIALQHPRNMGKPQYLNEAKNYILMGPRGYGKSYCAMGIIAQEFLTDSATEHGNPSVANIIVGAGHTNYSKGLLLKVQECLDKLPGKQIINGITYPSPLSKQTTGSLQPSMSLTAKYEKQIGKKWDKAGSGSFIKHVSYADNEFAGQGDRNTLMLYEEFGMFSNVVACHHAADSNMKLEGVKFGIGMYLGTGGDLEGGGTVGALEMYYDPEKFDCLAFQDV